MIVKIMFLKVLGIIPLNYQLVVKIMTALLKCLLLT